MYPPTPLERLILGRKYGVDEWIPLALQELCERPRQLTPDEARLMDFEDVVLVGSVREKVRNQAPLTVSSAGITSCIEALRRGEPQMTPPVGAETPPSLSSTPVFGATSTSAAIFGAGFGGFGGFGGRKPR